MNEKKYQPKLFGLKKKQVEQFISDLKQDMLQETTRMKDDISYWDLEMRQLERQITELEKALNSQHEESRIELAKERLPKVLSWMDKQSEREVDEQKAIFENQAESKRKELEQIELEIKNGSQLLQRLISQFTKGIEHLNDLGEIEETLSKEFSDASDISRNFLIPDPVVAQSFESTSDFWEDSNHFLSKYTDINQLPLTPIPPDDAEIPMSGPKIEESVDEMVRSEPSSSVEDDEENRHANAAQTKGNVQESEGIKQEIDHIKKRYIIGKLAGKDLYDAQGRLIIKKYDVISEDVVDKASQTAMLAELIVHMKIPGIGESSDE